MTALSDGDGPNANAGVTRRTFLRSAALGGAALAAFPPSTAMLPDDMGAIPLTKPADHPVAPLDLHPASWIWYPSQRCLPNTVVLFRRTLTLDAPPRSVTGWIAADSRYRLEVNGQRIQWGPSPCDPRWMEADPLDLTGAFVTGENALGAAVLFYGHGDGTWAAGKPGFIMLLNIEHADGHKEQLCTDTSWNCHLARSWPPGHYKRWYLRSLQEEFDARQFPYGWSSSSFHADDRWTPAMVLNGVSAADPPICSTYPEYAYDFRGNEQISALRPRSVPMLAETIVAARGPVAAQRLRWRRDPVEYFECLTPDAWEPHPTPLPVPSAGGAVEVPLEGSSSGVVLTYEMPEQMVGWPLVTIHAPSGTVVEVMVQEHHAPDGPPVMNNHYHSWTRFTCREGENSFETFDYESCRWLQLHVHGGHGTAIISKVGLRRRIFPWPHIPAIACSDPAVMRLAAASINTLHNSAQETVVDGMGRERQQYSGDGGHQLHALYYAFGETRLPARYLTTFSQGLTLDGYFLDCWPAYDRLARLWERQLGISYWGPLIDHGVGFVFDCWHHYLYTGDRESLREPYPRLLTFFQYLQELVTPEGLMPVEALGVPSVYIDHLAYTQQRHKQCAFTLYTAAMLLHALVPLCGTFGDAGWSRQARTLGNNLRAAAIRHFWDKRERVFVANLPWKSEEERERYCDRSLALSIMYDMAPGHETSRALQLLVDTPASLGLSYPANACWRLWALGKMGRTDTILHDFRTRWMAMESVAANNTLQEFWKEKPDGGSVMSHCGVVPLYILFQEIAGIRPIAPGFSRCLLRPRPADLEMLDVTAWTVRGPIRLRVEGKRGDRSVTVSTPPECETLFEADSRENLALPRNGDGRWRMPAGKEETMRLKYL